LENPFRYGEVVSGTFFTDRDLEIAEALADLRNGQNLVIISPRRYGKTSLLFEVAGRARREGMLTAYIDLLRTPSKERLANHLADAIYGGLVAPLERAWQRAVTVFQKLPLQPKITINSDGTPTFEFSPGAHAQDVDRTIERLLSLPGEIAVERRRRVVLVLDEFQEVVSLDPHLPAIMRSVFQLQADVAHVFAGSRRHLLQQVFTDVNQPMYRLAKPMPLRAIKPTEFARFIGERFAATQLSISPEAIQRILEITDGHPHDTQELCYFVWGLAIARPTPATSSVVDEALDRVLDAEEARFVTLWEGLTRHRRLVLSALAHEGARGIFSEGYRQRLGLGPTSSVHRTITYLVDRELLEFTPDSTYIVPDVFLRAWITRRMASPPIDLAAK